MKTQILSQLFAVLLVALNLRADDGSEGPLVVRFFGSSTCGECIEIKQELLRPLEKELGGMLEVKTYDIDTDEGLQLLIKLEEEYRVKQSSAQVLFLPDTFLTGADAIMSCGRSMILERVGARRTEGKQCNDSDAVDVARFLREKTKTWGFFLGTLATGLADGVNPCAIATMIFLISFLAMQKRKRSELLTIGLAYTATVYVTYFAMGVGLKELVGAISGYHYVSQIIRWGAFSAAAVVALLSFRDAIVFARTHKAQDITLQLPKAVKVRIHKVISKNLSGASLVIGSIVAGFLVTFLEAICTGQMYLPYIVAMTRQAQLRVWGLAYLAFYNLLFVLPLLIVMVLAYYGLQWGELAKKTQKNMVMLKVLLGLVMTGLALYLIFA